MKLTKYALITGMLLLACSLLSASPVPQLIGMVNFDRVNPALQILSGSPEFTEVTLNQPDIVWESQQVGFFEHSVPTIPGEPLNEVNGQPMVPQVTRLYQIPPRGTVELRITAADFELIENIDVVPFQTEGVTAVSTPWELSAAYDPDGWYPANIAQMSDPMIMRDVRLVGLTLYPVQVNPILRQARIYHNLQANLVATERPGINELEHPARPVSPDWMNIYRALIPNLDASTFEVSPIPGAYMLFYGSIHQQAADSLVKWKRQLGYVVETYLVDATHYTTPQSIRNAVQSRYDNLTLPPLEYVCLLGKGYGFPSSSAVPTENPTISDGDHFYAMLAGGDALPDIAVGRLPALTATESYYIVNKTLNYERTPPNTQWFQNATLIGGTRNQDFVSTSSRVMMYWAKEQFERMHPTGSTWFHTYLNNLSTILQEYAPELADPGAAFFLYRGTNIWDHAGSCPSGNTCPLVDISTGGKSGIGLFVTCGTGMYYEHEGEMATGWVRFGSTGIPKGGVAALGMAWIHTETQFDNTIMGGFVHAIVNRQIRSVGNAMVFSKEEIFSVHGPDGSNPTPAEMCAFTNLMGDPSISMWTQQPQILSYSPALPTQIAVGTRGQSVRVVDSQGQAVANVLVVALKGNSLVRAVTDNTGQAYLPLDNVTSAGTLIVTASKQNCIPAIREINCVQASRYVVYRSTTIDDGVGGDDLVNPGETIKLPINVKNYGFLTALGVSGDLKAITPGITVTGSTCAYPSIAAGQEAVPSNGATFKFTVSTTLSHLDSILLQLTMTFSPSIRTTSYFYLNCYSGQIRWDQDPAIPLVEENDHVLMPGEASHLRISLRNTGTVNVTGPVSAELICTNGFVSVPVKTGSYPSIAVGAQVTNPSMQFQVAATSCIYPGELAKMKLLITGYNYSFRDTVYFDLQIGTPAATDPTADNGYGYFAYESGDVIYNTATPFEASHPYDWTDISNIGVPVTGANEDHGEEYDVDPLNHPPYNYVQALPFTFRYFGMPYNEITIASNGWAALGDHFDHDVFRNYPIPGQQCPDNLIAPLWDDLRTLAYTGNPPAALGVWYYYDAANARVIIQWEARPATNGSNPNSPPNSRIEKFQVILKDIADSESPTADDVVIVQYNDITDPDVTSGDYQHPYSSMGIQSVGGAYGLSYQYGGTGPATVQALTTHQMTGRSVTYTTQTEEARTGRQISGLVTDESTGLPLSGMRVTLVGTGLVVLTQANGTYQFNGLHIGTYSVRCDEPGPIYHGYQAEQVDDLYLACDLSLIQNFAMSSGSGGGSIIGLSPNALEVNLVSGNVTETVLLANHSVQATDFELRFTQVLSSDDVTRVGNEPEVRREPEQALLTAVNFEPQEGQIKGSRTASVQVTFLVDRFTANGDYAIVAIDPVTGVELGPQTTVHVSGVSEAIPTEFALYQNFPNPFNPSTQVKYDVPVAGSLSLKVFNTLGQVVTTIVDEYHPAGRFSAYWDGSGMASGIYVLQLQAPGFVSNRKMVLLR